MLSLGLWSGCEEAWQSLKGFTGGCSPRWDWEGPQSQCRHGTLLSHRSARARWAVSPGLSLGMQLLCSWVLRVGSALCVGWKTHSATMWHFADVPSPKTLFNMGHNDVTHLSGCLAVGVEVGPSALWGVHLDGGCVLFAQCRNRLLTHPLRVVSEGF